MMHPDVWCIILNYNGWRDTLECLESVARLDYPGLRVIVVDNASTNDSVRHVERWARGDEPAPVATDAQLRLLSEPPVQKPVSIAVLDAERDAPLGGAPLPWLTVLRSPVNAGFAAGNNVALRFLIRRNAGGHAWLLNNDTVVAADTVRHLVAALEGNAGAGAVGCTLLEYTDPDRIQAAAGGTLGMWGATGRSIASGLPRGTSVDTAPDYLCGASVMVPFDVIRTVGLLDERFFMYSEDADWSMRMRSAGLQLVYAPAAEVWHKGGASAGDGTPFSDYHNVRSPLLLVGKHRPLLLPLVALYMLGRCVLPKVARRQRQRLAAATRGFADAFRAMLHPRATLPPADR